LERGANYDIETSEDSKVFHSSYKFLKPSLRSS